jgi:hypothetical protein
MAEKHPLQAWLDANDVTMQQLGDRVACSGVHIGRICGDDPRVSTDLAVRIFRETGVRVGPLRNVQDEDVEVVARTLARDGAAA